MSLESDRERIVETLSAHFAEDHLTTQELEVRFERAYKASTLDQLRDVVAGLPALSRPAVSPVPLAVATPAIRPVGSRRERRHVAIMSNLRKGGHWTPDRLTTIRALMADVTIDLRDATFVDSEIEFDLVAVMAVVSVETRLPGETKLAARRRLRLKRAAGEE